MKNFNKELQAKKTKVISDNIKLLGESIRLMAAKDYKAVADLQFKITANTNLLIAIDEQLKQQQNGI